MPPVTLPPLQLLSVFLTFSLPKPLIDSLLSFLSLVPSYTLLHVHSLFLPAASHNFFTLPASLSLVHLPAADHNWTPLANSTPKEVVNVGQAVGNNSLFLDSTADCLAAPPSPIISVELSSFSLWPQWLSNAFPHTHFVGTALEGLSPTLSVGDHSPSPSLVWYLTDRAGWAGGDLHGSAGFSSGTSFSILPRSHEHSWPQHQCCCIVWNCGLVYKGF